MRRATLLILAALVGASLDEREDSIEEGRIAADLPADSIVTLHPSFRPIINGYRGCYARIVSRNKKSFAWDNTEWAMLIKAPVVDSVGTVYHLRLGVFCADGTSATWTLMIRVSKLNLHKPRFEQDDYVFYVPRERKAGAAVGRVRVWDEDPVIYNSKLSMVLLGLGKDGFRLATDGRLTLHRPLLHTAELVLQSCDYGSPRKCAEAPLRIVPVSVTQPRTLKVEASTEKYQILSWERPDFGNPDSYTVIIDEKIRLDITDNRVSFPSTRGRRQTVAVYFPLDRSKAYFVRVTANSAALNESTPAEPIRLMEVLRRISCSSRCQPGGEPVCYWDGARAKQFYEGDDPQCLCHPGFTGLLCKDKEECLATIAYTGVGPTVWEPTRVNSTAFAFCPYGPKSVRMTRQCLIDTVTKKPHWSLIDLTYSHQCTKKSTLLTKLALDSLVSLENYPLTGVRLRNFAKKLEDVQFTSYVDNQVARTIIGLIGEVMAQDLSFLPPPEEMDIRNRFAYLLQDYTTNVIIYGRHETLKKGGLTTATPEITVGVFPVKSDKVQPVHNLTRYVTVQLGEELHFQPQRLSVVVLGKPAFYPTRSGVNPQESILEVRLDRLPRIYSAALLRYHITPRYPPIDVNTTKKNYTCVYYDTMEKEWDTEGVLTVKGRPNAPVECISSHLTGFSIIFVARQFPDFNSERALSEAHRDRLNMLSWIGCTLSIAGLAATITTYLIFRPLHKDKSGKILVSLCFSLGLLNLVFIVSSLRPWTLYQGSHCIAIGASLHYLTLSTLLWMGVEAANMYAMLVRVFSSTESCFLLKRSLIAWGTPVLVVGMVLSVDSRSYLTKHDYYCRLTARSSALAHWGGLVVPACVILLINCVVFILVLRALFGPAREAVRKTSTGSDTKRSTLVVQVRGAVTVMALLGVTWVFGMLAVGPGQIVFMYVFAVLNSLQGLIIFLTRCLFHPVARQCWVELLTGKQRSAPGSVASPSNSTTRSHLVRSENRSATESPVVTRARVVTFRDPKEPLLQQNGNGHSNGHVSPVIHKTRSPIVRMRESLVRRFPSISLTSWKYVDDPPSPVKTAPSHTTHSPTMRVNLDHFEEE